MSICDEKKNASYLIITEKAKEKLYEFLDKRKQKSDGVKIAFQIGGCSGISHKLEFANYGINIDSSDDVLFIDNKLSLFIDKRVVLSIFGSTMDFEESEVSSGFVFRRQSKEGCCGAGFC